MAEQSSAKADENITARENTSKLREKMRTEEARRSIEEDAGGWLSRLFGVFELELLIDGVVRDRLVGDTTERQRVFNTNISILSAVLHDGGRDEHRSEERSDGLITSIIIAED
jgi:hypothetical protein